MPTFRRPQAIGASIRTLLEGSWTDFELLVRDDGNGQDGTREAVIAAASGDPRVCYHHNERNLRMPGNLNEGIKASRGEFIAVCHDHDLYKPTFIETMLATLRRNPSALFVHCAIETIAQGGAVTNSHIGEWPELTPGAEWLRFMLRSLNCPVCALTLVRREAHERYGLYDLSCGFIADVEMWMRLSSYGDVAYVGKPLIRVSEREENHAETVNNVRWIKTAAEIHRRYLTGAFSTSNQLLRRLRLELEFGNKYFANHSSRLVKKILPFA
jgi:glycosyltransferase involved in cell wall biosynthesis